MYHSTVRAGQKIGRTIDFPTINLDPTVVPKQTIQGVYASWVTVKGKQYKGALYYGPRLVFNEEHLVLEIYILNFSAEVYGEEVSFTIESFIRPPMNFPSLESLTRQLIKDTADVERALTNLG